MPCTFQGINHAWAESTCVILKMHRRILAVWFDIEHTDRVLQCLLEDWQGFLSLSLQAENCVDQLHLKIADAITL